jgi:hypothetical protein
VTGLSLDLYRDPFSVKRDDVPVLPGESRDPVLWTRTIRPLGPYLLFEAAGSRLSPGRAASRSVESTARLTPGVFTG